MELLCFGYFYCDAHILDGSAVAEAVHEGDTVCEHLRGDIVAAMLYGSVDSVVANDLDADAVGYIQAT